MLSESSKYTEQETEKDLKKHSTVFTRKWKKCEFCWDHHHRCQLPHPTGPASNTGLSTFFPLLFYSTVLPFPPPHTLFHAHYLLAYLLISFLLSLLNVLLEHSTLFHVLHMSITFSLHLSILSYIRYLLSNYFISYFIQHQLYILKIHFTYLYSTLILCFYYTCFYFIHYKVSFIHSLYISSLLFWGTFTTPD